MRKTALFIAMCVLVGLLGLLSACAAEAAPHNDLPAQGYVPDADTAIRIAVAVLEPIYGKDEIAGEAPFTATLNDGVWRVQGSLPEPFTLGGVALVEITKRDGRIVRVSHGK